MRIHQETVAGTVCVWPGASSSTAPVRATTSRFPSSSSSGTKDSEDGGSETGGEEGREDGEASGEDTGNDETADEDGTKQPVPHTSFSQIPE